MLLGHYLTNILNEKMSKFKEFLNKASKVAPEVLNVAGKILTGNIGGAVQEVGDILKGKAENDIHAKELYLEFQMEQMNFEKEIYALEVEDRKSARNREVEKAKTGQIDWLMYATGLTGLGSFIMIIYAVIFIPSVMDNELFIHLMGMVEGVAISNLFAYYFGTSKSSADKNELLKGK